MENSIGENDQCYRVVYLFEDCTFWTAVDNRTRWEAERDMYDRIDDHPETSGVVAVLVTRGGNDVCSGFILKGGE